MSIETGILEQVQESRRRVRLERSLTVDRLVQIRPGHCLEPRLLELAPELFSSAAAGHHEPILNC